MKLGAKSDYAARAVLGLARKYAKGGALRVEELAADQGLPPNYLVQILIELKGRRIVRSVRGKEGGYHLARPPVEITLGEVLRCVQGQVFEPPGSIDQPGPPELQAAWRQLQDAIERAADGINFQQLLEAGADKEKMYYI